MLVGWLDRNGQLDPLAHPCDRVTRDLIRAFITEYGVGRAETTVASAVRGMVYVLRACAPPDGVGWLTKLAHSLTNTAKPSRPKLPRMVRVSDLVLLSDRLMDIGLEKLGQGHRSGAPIYRDGLIIGLLIHRPMRRRNLTDLRIGHNLFIDDFGIRITIPREETKKGVPFEGRVPERLEPAVFIYLDRVRPVLMKNGVNDNGWLWIGRQGRRMPADDISIRVTKTTREHFGRDLSPHLFRDCAATEVALERPELIGMTKHLLGYMSSASSQKSYNQATSLTAFSRHAEVIRKLRGEGS
ncbi:MAG: hypothetical protein EP345_17050 [Sphingomonadales bacterium]|nr:MAG: hypothetical protein EP345_17050 [Sphingomonadales bacterium]